MTCNTKQHWEGTNYNYVQWINLTNMFSKRYQILKNTYIVISFTYSKASRQNKSIVIEVRMVVTFS